MRNFAASAVFCLALLVSLGYWLSSVSASSDNAILDLLKLPAPPAINPLSPVPAGSRPPSFYDRQKPPPDDAPIADIMDYWERMSSSYRDLGYNPEPTATVANRIMRELAADPYRITSFYNALGSDRRAVDMIRDAWRKAAAGDERLADYQSTLKAWLTYNTPDFSSDLEPAAANARDEREYVSNHNELLGLSKVDWERAEPHVKKLYEDKSQGVARVLATWALYRHELNTGGLDESKYRDELKAVVEDKKASAGMRDMALDALVKEKEWSGRDDWYIALLEDETLADLRVNGTSYTGLTTIMYYASDDRLAERMLPLMDHDNIVVRTAVAKNLFLWLANAGETDRNAELRRGVVRSVLPWLRDPRVLRLDGSQRYTVLRALASLRVPESVPVLIELLEEEPKMMPIVNGITSNVNSGSANAFNTVANAAKMAANTANTAVYASTINRGEIVSALAFQKDPRAVPALRRVLIKAESWQRPEIVGALLETNGFTNDEQVAALEFLARSAAENTAGTNDSGVAAYSRLQIERRASSLSTTPGAPPTSAASPESEYEAYRTPEIDDAETPETEREMPDPDDGPWTEATLKYHLAAKVAAMKSVSDELVQSTVERLVAMRRREPLAAENLRKIVMGWQSPAVNALLLSDVRSGAFDADTVLKLLADRKSLRERHMAEIGTLRTGHPSGVGIGACLAEDEQEFAAILASGAAAAKLSLLACGRLIRAKLPVRAVIGILTGNDKVLSAAAERFLEVEDSAAAREALYTAFPGRAKVLGAKSVFAVEGMTHEPGSLLRDVFATVNPYFGATEYTHLAFESTTDDALTERLRKEVTSTPDLLGIYAFDRKFVRIYADRAVFSWEDDPARYRERTLEAEQFEALKNFLAQSEAADLPPFLSCVADCQHRELLMLGKAGGRRVFAKTSWVEPSPELFAGLESFFVEMKKPPSQLKYYAAADLPGLEIVFANDDHKVETLWKDSSGISILFQNAAQLKVFNRDIEIESERELESARAQDKPTTEIYRKWEQIRGRRYYDSFSWMRISGGKIVGPAVQPAEAQYIPVDDGRVPPSSFGEWTRKAPGFEVREGSDGLFKIANGRSTLFKKGNYYSPVVAANGRWIVAIKYDDDEGMRPLRIDTTTNREIEIPYEDSAPLQPVAAVPGRDLVLATYLDDHHDDHGESPETHPSAYDDGTSYSLIDPSTGRIFRGPGELRPLSHQTFRALQSTGTPNEYWAAIPRGESGTLFGIYSTRTFTFRPILKMPRLIFDSVQTYVDSAERKLYFVHKGHVLSVPLPAVR